MSVLLCILAMYCSFKNFIFRYLSNPSIPRGYGSVIRRMKILVCVSIDSLWVFVLSVLNWEGKDGKVRVGLIILYKFSAKCRLLLCRSFQMISSLNSDNYMYIKPMIEACR